MFAKWDFVRLEGIQLGKRVCYRAYPNRAGEEDRADAVRARGPDGWCKQEDLKGPL